MTYKEALRKRKLETALAKPIVLLGMLLSKLFRPKGRHQLFIFSPSGDIGGANLNNADIAKLFPGLQPIVIFSKQPKNNLFLHYYDSQDVTIWDIHNKIDHKWYHFVNIFYRGVIAQWINTTTGAVVIGGESLYFHKVLPWLNINIRTIELSHLDTWFDYTQQFVNDIDVRVFSTQRLMKDAEAFYDRQHIDRALKLRMVFIDNMIPDIGQPVINEHSELEVIFIGRSAPQKRVHLIATIAEQAHNKKLPIHFSFAGDVSDVIEAVTLPYCTFYGNVRDRKQLESIQKSADVLLLTSGFEGLPMAVMEMMAFGKVIISTAVNAIPDYIKDGVNGFLIPDHIDPFKIVDDAVLALTMLAFDRQLLKEMGIRNNEEAKERFGRERFAEKWEKLVRM